MLHKLLAAAALLFCIAGIRGSAQTAEGRAPVIRQLDHVLVEASDPKALYELFVETFELPPAWPAAENQGYVSGGVSAGNVNLEFYRYGERQIPEARYSGLAFEPFPLADALRELQLRSIPHGPPEPYISNLPDGSRGVAWTTVQLPSFSKPGTSVFLYEYSPVFLQVAVRRKQLWNRLTLNKGGRLGVLSVGEIIISTTDYRKDREAWGLLLGKPAPSGSYRAGTGPAIRIVAGEEDRIREIVFKVESLDRARAFLKTHKLLGSGSADAISLNPKRVQGLRIRLTAR